MRLYATEWIHPRNELLTFTYISQVIRLVFSVLKAILVSDPCGQTHPLRRLHRRRLVARRRGVVGQHALLMSAAQAQVSTWPPLSLHVGAGIVSQRRRIRSHVRFTLSQYASSVRCSMSSTSWLSQGDPDEEIAPGVDGVTCWLHVTGQWSATETRK